MTSLLPSQDEPESGKGVKVGCFFRFTRYDKTTETTKGRTFVVYVVFVVGPALYFAPPNDLEVSAHGSRAPRRKPDLGRPASGVLQFVFSEALSQE